MNTTIINLKNNINIHRNKLNSMILSQANSNQPILTQEILKLSQELDKLILEYIIINSTTNTF